jgi:hypothetical protein
MALYNGQTRKVRNTSNPEKYTVLRKVGSKPAGAGIYECQSCGQEDVINRECPILPPCSVCKEDGHNWKLIVRAQGADEKDNQPYA